MAASPWQVVQRAGLPLACERTGAAPSLDALASAVTEILAHDEPPAGREREALGAFLLAWRHGWPTSFAQAFGDRAARVLDWAAAGLTDPNRYLKLRRIAMAHLATVL